MKTILKICLALGSFAPIWVIIIGFEKDVNGRQIEDTRFQFFTTVVGVFLICWGLVFLAAKKLESGDIKNASFITIVYGLFLTWCYLSAFRSLPFI